MLSRNNNNNNNRNNNHSSKRSNSNHLSSSSSSSSPQRPPRNDHSVEVKVEEDVSSSFREEHKLGDTNNHTHSTSYDPHHHHHHPALIYAAPTVDTLGDDESTLCPAPFATPKRTTTPANNHNHNHNITQRKKSNHHHHHRNNNNTHNCHSKQPSPKDFQVEQDSMAVFVRTIPVAERLAFDNVPSLQPPHVLLLNKRQQKCSPSLQHLRLLKTLQSQTHLSQLSFRPSVSLASDIIGDTTSSTTSTHVVRDGRYRSIDPVQATLLRLPPNPPLLSNKKHRLPMRADVGFANTPADEMQQKQLEIQQETAWEEASPRLVVLVTSDDLGTAVESESMPPFVGPELRQAKERNHVHFDRSIPPPPRASSSAPSPPLANNNNNNNTSMLAPPLDATYSASMGWRPRPFYDRPPGMKYVLVSPLKLEFETGPLEPLIGSLTLYRLDNNNNNNNGKASEAFYFPAGDWNGRLAANNHANHANMATTAETKVWMERAHKAIFSYDPLVLHHPQQLYVVLQVSKVTHLELAAAYLAGKKTSSSQQQQQQQPSTTSSFRKRWKQHFRGAGGVKADDAEKTRYRSNTVWDSHGTQFVSPLCFGVTPLFPNQQKQQASWPKGDVQQHVPLYCYPPQSESQEQFCQRLSAIVSRLNNNSSNGGQWNTTGPLQSQQQSLSTLYEPSSSSSSVDNQSVTSNSMESAEFASPNKKKSLRFRISPKKLSPKINSNSTTKRSKKDGLATNPKQQQQQQPLQDTPILKANVCLFTSALPVDFLQSMLQTPPEIRNRSSTLPKILVDASGESAIMMDPKTKATTDGSSSNPQKRSNLLRLPPRKGGYSDACDFREVLFLPPRPSPKQYDVVDVAAAPPLYKSILNLLYLYPRMLLRLEKNNHNNSSKGNKRQQRYTIRIRLVQQNLAETSNHSNSSSTPMIESSNTVLESFHNPTPWAGPSLLKTVYTKIPGDTTFSNSKQQLQYDDLKAGIPLKDEFKMKLPMVLDGNYFLHFKLFAVEFQDDLDDSASVSVDGSVTEDAACGISTRSLAETTIPLVSSSIRDPKSGVKATTIIPNGCHRLRLGDFQLQMETRLLSSIHVADPVVATALRDFPFCHSDEALSGERLSELALVTKRTVVSRQDSRGGDSSASVASTMPGKVPYSTLFATASGSALVAHFQPLLFMHLSNLVNVRSSNGNRGPEASEKFLMENAQSFLEICRRVKTTFLSSHPDGQKRFAAFIKTTMDSFDEGFLHSSNPKEDLSDDDSASEVMPVEHSRSNPSTNPSVSGEDEKDDEFDGGAIRRRKKSLRSGIDIRISKTFSAMEQSEKAPFSRVAYGATKTDRMRLEAELDVENSRFSHLADDDETVVTLATTLTGEARMAEAREAFEKTRLSSPKSFHKEDNSEANSLKEGSRSEDSHGIDFGAYQRSISELAFTKRVRSAAQVMLAPCGTANLSAVFSSPRNAASKSETKDEAQSESSKPSIKSQLPDHSDRALSMPGSDIEEEDYKDNESLSFYHTREGTFRSPSHCPVLIFSIVDDRNRDRFHLPMGRGDFVYESVFVLWIRAWMDQVKKEIVENGSGPRHVPSIIPSFGEDINALFMFHSHLDVMLPLCLKSIVLRYGQSFKTSHSGSARVIVDEGHMNVLATFVEMLALTLMGQGMAGLKSNSGDRALQNALLTSDHVLDFLTGLLAVFHPAHMALLIRKFFMTLRNCELEDTEGKGDDFAFEWTEETLHRVKCSRQLRLRAVEKLAVLPNFVALNYPLRFSSRQTVRRKTKTTWTTQYSDSNQEAPSASGELERGIDDLLPRSGWLAELLTSECLSICSLSCEAVVAEAMAHIEIQETTKTSSSESSSLKKRPTASLNRADLLMFQSIAIHGITCVHELLLRRHAMDKRFQTESSRERIAALFLKPIFEKSVASVRWLARMESTHRVRSLWLLCFVYILQEAPENLLREAVSSYSSSKDAKIHRFIRLLRLGSSTFQSFIDQQRYCMFPSEIDSGISPWLLQESFNTICATTIVVVEECASTSSTSPKEQKKMIQGILDLLLHVLTTPQSCVTHLRAVGGAIQAFEKFGIEMFLEIAGGSLQHWIRIILSLMNSIALSVRSIAVDFVISLLGSAFDSLGNIDELALIFVTVLPEVAAREIALCSVSGHINNLEDVEKSIWPLRRSFADIEDANPLDDDRVDPQLSPVLSVFCRGCQAMIDGVLIEMRLQGRDCVVVGARMKSQPLDMYTFDADEESLFEAASFFLPETGPVQRVRWLMTLKSLHKSKGQWVEAAETLMMCARTISDSIPHLKHVWRPSRFPLWSDTRRSLWLSTVGEEMGNPERGNEQVMSFADNFLEPDLLDDSNGKPPSTSRLPQPTVSGMCALLTSITKEAVSMYVREEGMDGRAYTRLESLLKILMDSLDEHGMNGLGSSGRTRFSNGMGRKRYVEEEASLRKVIASISGDMTKLAERLLGVVQDDPTNPAKASEARNNRKPQNEEERLSYFIRVHLSGKKPSRFLESTTLPTFLEWDKPCICRVPKKIVESALAASAGRRHPERLEEIMCLEFVKPLRNALQRDNGSSSIVFRVGNQKTPSLPEEGIFVDVAFVQMHIISSFADAANQREDLAFGHQSKHFFYRIPQADDAPGQKSQTLRAGGSTGLMEMTVANSFPCPLSRQRTVLTSEFVSTK